MSALLAKQERFDVRMEADQTWTVFDVFSGLVVFWNGLALLHLDADVAFSIVDELNEMDFERRRDLDY